MMIPGPALATVDDTVPDTTVVYSDEGDPAQQVILPPPMAVGSMRIVDEHVTTGRVVLEGNQPTDTPIDLTVSAARVVDVTTVNDDGTYTADVTFESHDLAITAGDDFAENLAGYGEYGALEGLTLTMDFLPSGDVLALGPGQEPTLTPEQQAAIEELISSDRNLIDALPDEPIGAGAVWTTPVNYLGTYTVGEFALSSLVDGEYVIDFSLEMDSAELATTDLPGRFQSADGTVSLTGTMRGDAKDPFTGVRDGVVNFDVTYTGPDGELTLQIETTVRQTIQPA